MKTDQQVRELVSDLQFALDFTEPLHVILKRFEDILRPHFPSAGAAPPLDTPPEPNMQELIEREMVRIRMTDELRAWLDTQHITGDTIGDIRRQCFMPWDCGWNGIVRDETAKREIAASPPLDTPQPELTLEVVVNGQPVNITIAASANVRDVIEPALAQAGTVSRLDSEWEVRLADGGPLQLDQPIAAYVGQRLWINLRAGYAAAQLPSAVETTPKEAR